MLAGQIGALAIVNAYNNSSIESPIPGSVLLWTAVALSVGFLGAFLTFLSIVNPGYGSTFTSTQRAPDAVAEIFHGTDEEGVKLAVFKYPEYLWGGIRADVKAFVEENQEEWQREHAPFWTPKLIKRIPNDMLSTATLEQKTTFRRKAKGYKEGASEKKPSVFESIVDEVMDMYSSSSSSSSSS